jgi:hypothetical protein
MTRQAYNALKESIQHWKRLSEGKRLPNEFIGGKNCALCCEFIDSRCKGCPVYEKKKTSCCHSTPWTSITTFLTNNNISAHGHELYKHPEFLKLAKLELSFLQGLLPMEEEVEEEEEVDLGF